ncbi:hypothetical protein Misp01_24890 [Microtetraspora sp. NBRC 13810]|uniref:hypothetical protein n=1 Tax=Microtetraspora sp. NBRC 13810 TaxID=3030990 RepID=UPI0024A2731C|nr:hypothetical protein [Microtetraspora sp. NBRC 13810]GLW07359.1 hypothetical protein Misp01_24890 [Microtetraspora sp. NBRC 13810]
MSGRQVTSAVSHLTALAAVLSSLSLDTQMEDGDEPKLIVTNPRAPQLSESITVAADPDGVQQFWWSWHKPIAAVENRHAVAMRIKFVLTPARTLR